MATQIFEITGKRKGSSKDHRYVVKVAGGRHDEESLMKHFKKVRHPILKKLDGLKIAYKGDENAEAIDENGNPVPPSPELLKTLDPRTGREREELKVEEKEEAKEEARQSKAKDADLPPRAASDGTVGKGGPHSA